METITRGERGMRNHPKRLAAAGIDEHRYEELRAVCRQYPKCKRRMEMARAGIVDRPERRGGAWRRPDPTGNAAMLLADNPDAKRVRLIDMCVNRVAEPAVAGPLLKYLTTGLAYNYMQPRPPVGRNQFYILALLFYIELDREMW